MPKSTKIDDSAIQVERLIVSPRGSRRYTGLGLPTTFEFLEAGIIPAIREGRRWLIPVAALKDALSQIALAQSQRRQARRP